MQNEPTKQKEPEKPQNQEPAQKDPDPEKPQNEEPPKHQVGHQLA